MRLRHRRSRVPPPWPPAESFLRRALLDAAHDAYANWLQAASGVERLYARWCDAKRAERTLAYAAYAAALDREERAAEVHADLIRTAATRLGAT